MTSLLRQAVLTVADRPALERVVTGHGQRVVSRFVAGTGVADGLRVADELARQGLGTILDLLGEGVRSTGGAEEAAAELREVIRAIAAHAGALQDASARRGAPGPVELAVKMSHLGAQRDPALAAKLLSELLEGDGGRVFVWIDMEGSDLTETTVSTFEALRPEHPHLGLVLQACMRRSGADLARVAHLDPAVRIVKGAYLEPPSLAFTRKAEVDSSFAALVESCLEAGTRVAVATHDRALVARLEAAASRRGVGPEALEFQLLYGIASDLAARLAGEGRRTKVYVPFGSAWYPYFSRRLAERPANLWFLARALLGPQRSAARNSPTEVNAP